MTREESDKLEGVLFRLEIAKKSMEKYKNYLDSYNIIQPFVVSDIEMIDESMSIIKNMRNQNDQN